MTNHDDHPLAHRAFGDVFHDYLKQTNGDVNQALGLLGQSLGIVPANTDEESDDLGVDVEPAKSANPARDDDTSPRQVSKPAEVSTSGAHGSKKPVTARIAGRASVPESDAQGASDD